MMNFNPKIEERSNDDLLDIIADKENWNEVAVRLAEKELRKRNVPQSKISERELFFEKLKEIEIKQKANESFDFASYLFHPLGAFEMVFSSGLKKNGYIKKARQQKVAWVVTACLFIILYAFVKLSQNI
jgi:actin-related protein